MPNYDQGTKGDKGSQYNSPIAKAASKQAPAVPTEHGEAMQRHINRTHNPKRSDKVINRRGRVRHGGGPGSGRPEGK